MLTDVCCTRLFHRCCAPRRFASEFLRYKNSQRDDDDGGSHKPSIAAGMLRVASGELRVTSKQRSEIATALRAEPNETNDDDGVDSFAWPRSQRRRRRHVCGGRVTQLDAGAHVRTIDLRSVCHARHVHTSRHTAKNCQPLPAAALMEQRRAARRTDAHPAAHPTHVSIYGSSTRRCV